MGRRVFTPNPGEGPELSERPRLAVKRETKSPRDQPERSFRVGAEAGVEGLRSTQGRQRQSIPCRAAFQQRAFPGRISSSGATSRPTLTCSE